ncbi:MAG: hypothetical protein AAFX99_00745 [Myxococcota bacterium]
MAIRDQSYTDYTGDLIGAPPAWVIAANDLRLYWSYRRTKLLFIGALFVMMPFVFGVLAERFLLGSLGVSRDNTVGMLFHWMGAAQIWMCVAFFAGVACGVIADDVRYRTIQLYFSKPIRAVDYALGKFGALMLLGSLVTLLPSMLVGALRTGVLLAAGTEPKIAVLELVGLLGFNVIMLAVLSLVLMALSSLISRTGYVVLAWLGVILIPSMVSTTVGFVRSGEPWTELLSLSGTLWRALDILVQYKGEPVSEGVTDLLPSYMTWAPWPVLVVVVGIAVAAVAWRLSRMEGIA